MSDISFSEMTVADIEDIALLFSATGRQIDHEKVKGLISEFSGILARKGKNLIGFAYTGRFAPDVALLYNIYVTKECRSLGVGWGILSRIEETCLQTGCHAIILSNSALFKNLDDKRDAVSFYVRHGYRVIEKTSDTNIFFKNLIGSAYLPPPP